MTEITYYPPESAAVSYLINTDDIERLGDCISFTNKQKERITFCQSSDQYEERIVTK